MLNLLGKKLKILTMVSIISVCMSGCGSSELDFNKTYKKGVSHLEKYQKNALENKVDDYRSHHDDLVKYAERMEQVKYSDYARVLYDVTKYASKVDIKEYYIKNDFKEDILVKASTKDYLDNLYKKSYYQLISDYYYTQILLLEFEPNPVYEFKSEKEFKSKVGYIAYEYQKLIIYTIQNKKKISSYQGDTIELAKYKKHVRDIAKPYTVKLFIKDREEVIQRLKKSYVKEEIIRDKMENSPTSFQLPDNEFDPKYYPKY